MLLCPVFTFNLEGETMPVTWKYVIAYQHDNPMYKPVEIYPAGHDTHQNVPVYVLSSTEYDTAEEAGKALEDPVTSFIFQNPVIIKLEYIT